MSNRYIISQSIERQSAYIENLGAEYESLRDEMHEVGYQIDDAELELRNLKAQLEECEDDE